MANCGYVDVICEKRLKHCSLPDDGALVNAAVQIGKVDEDSDELRDAIVRATADKSARYKQTDGSYLFPDSILVAKAVKPGR